MHYHIAKNPDYRSTGLPYWSTSAYFVVLPEVTGKELARSTVQCAMRDGLIVAKQAGERTVEVLVNNNGRRRAFTPRSLVDFLVSCRNKGDSVSIDDRVIGAYVGAELERELARIFGEDNYVITSARSPGEQDLQAVLPKLKAQAIPQQAPARTA